MLVNSAVTGNFTPEERDEIMQREVEVDQATNRSLGGCSSLYLSRFYL